MKRFRAGSLRRSLLPAGLGLALLLALPRPAEPVEVGELMKKMGEVYGRLIEVILVKPIKEIVDTPFGEVKKDAAAIVRVAQELPRTEGNEDSKDFKVLARQLLGRARQLERSADKKSLREAAGALAGIQGACLSCHNEFRF